MAEDSKSQDSRGLKPRADSTRILLSQTAVDRAAAFLSRICHPVAEEFGPLLQEQMKSWRAANAVRIANKAEDMLAVAGNAESVLAPPRLVFNVLESGSLVDGEFVQDLWAGLLSSSCTESGEDDSNLLFISFLSQMTTMQAEILDFVCLNTRYDRIKEGGGFFAGGLPSVSPSQFIQNLERDGLEVGRVRLAIHWMRSVGLFLSDVDPSDPNTEILKEWRLCHPSYLALTMCMRCRGSRLSPDEFAQDLQKTSDNERNADPLQGLRI